MRWLAVLNAIADPACLTSNTVDYKLFLSQFTLALSQKFKDRVRPMVAEATPPMSPFMKPYNPQYLEVGHVDDTITDTKLIGEGFINSIYSSLDRQLQLAFNFFDTDNDGIVSGEDIRRGWGVIVESQRLNPTSISADLIMNLMDLDCKGFISFNKFLETYRLFMLCG